MKNTILAAATMFLWFTFSSCTSETTDPPPVVEEEIDTRSEMQKKVDQYAVVPLSADLNTLSDNQKEMLGVLIEAAKIMDSLFWYEAYGEPAELLAAAKDEAERRLITINYGPWDRLSGNASFVDGVGEKPAGANYYPQDMTKEEFEASTLEDKAGLYTFLRRNEGGELISIPYHEMFAEQVQRTADLLRKAADLADSEEFKNYLLLRADAMLNDEYQPSDMAWMDMKSNEIDVVIGPIETYEDQLYGYKASHECFVLVKDMSWSERLAKYAAFLPELQENLPVADAYKQETPGSDADLNAYDVIYYAGDCNSGSKTIAINLPNDEEVQLEKGTRRLQLQNAMRAKYDQILLPLADVLVDDEQKKLITFDAFFANTMFHEVAHGLGVKNTINGKGTVRENLKELASALEEGKADVLGLYMVKQLHDKGEVEGDLQSYYVTFMAGIFRSVRFGASSAHGRANMIRFNYFKEKGAFSYSEETGKYTVNFDTFEEAMASLAELILTLQGDGDYDGVAKLVAEKGTIGADLQKDLDRLTDLEIPVDIVFEQGLSTLGLE